MAQRVQQLGSKSAWHSESSSLAADQHGTASPAARQQISMARQFGGGVAAWHISVARTLLMGLHMERSTAATVYCCARRHGNALAQSCGSGAHA
eukprot:1147744-Pelagomonas_calceolata.AAC.3